MTRPLCENPSMTKKYEEAANQISSWIFDSAFSAGDRLPSIRTLSQTMKVSVTTVVAGLRLLESRGLVEARDRAGYFVSTPVKRAEARTCSKTKRPMESEHRQSDGDHFRLTLKHGDAVLLGTANPSDHYLPIRQIQKSLLRSVRRTTEFLSYSFPGYPRYLEAVGRRMTIVGVTAKASDIIATGGAQESVALALKSMARPGDEIAVFVPASPATLQAIRTLDLSVVEIPCKSTGEPDLDALEPTLLSTDIKALCISANVSNPTGLTLSDDEKLRLLKISYDKNIPIIEDDVCGDLSFGTSRPSPLKAFDREGAVIYCSSFSKTVSPGLRSGWIMPGRFHAEISDQKYSMNLSSPAVTQMALADYLDSGAHELYLRKIRRTYQRNTIKIRELVLRKFPDGASCTVPDGGFTLWVTLPSEINTTDVYPVARDSGLCFAPGQIFSSTGRFSNSLRVSGARPIDAAFENGITFLANEFEKYQAQVRNSPFGIPPEK